MIVDSHLLLPAVMLLGGRRKSVQTEMLLLQGNISAPVHLRFVLGLGLVLGKLIHRVQRPVHGHRLVRRGADFAGIIPLSCGSWCVAIRVGTGRGARRKGGGAYAARDGFA